ncbi:MAG: hypothetical protein GWM98_27445, partial [Nitrospinaceae bacterium]|nr:hypothetical protein [Nitrospinaceae bacterium]NIR57509.1 hypothetical protein [Nitrospinaceae bacterium]NIS87979.1 hypothetical protein [Nitrospinaceae bacterium]NIT84844.1 hypothetical protein [Nitrospinaceae bacterium]NIU47024.1 hypothetical protein [Nitrospinaceae bacterium]
EGDREKTYIRPVLLDVNPVRHRQSLQEQVFPVPRAIHESLLDVGKLKMMIEAGAGMGKTTFLKYCLEGLLQQEVHSVYPLPVYFHLGELPEGTGFAEFFDRGYRRMRDLILREQEELPD